MSQRETALLWLKDTIEHLKCCQRQLEWVENPEAIQVLVETMLRDLECCRRLCSALRERCTIQHA